MKFIYIILVYVYCVYCLAPKRLPNGKLIHYHVNRESPANDLKVLNPGQASIITKNWLENIVVDLFNKENNKLKNNEFSDRNIFDYDELHIVTNINKLEQYIQESYQISKHAQDKQTLFLSWMPRGDHGRTEVLFIIVAQINALKKEFIIRHLVQSPFWDPAQIDSCELKSALIAQNEKNNCTSINLEYLYENDLRYKLAWAIWNLTDDINRYSE